METTPLISVIVPAYNAEHYIEHTLASATGQTYENIEILVIDDGSTDRTTALVERLASIDIRLRLIRQANSGVAAARNAGIRSSRGTYIAPLDADDLWHPTKLEKQLAVFAVSGPEVGLVYTLSRFIDADDRVRASAIAQRPVGWVFMQHANRNFIGNGSSPLIRRSILEEVGGYSSRLRLSGVEGCEDFFLQLSIASRYQFGMVPEYLVGYRQIPTNMSSDVIRMKLSRKRALKSILKCCSPAAKPTLMHAIHRNDINIVLLGIKCRDYRNVVRACGSIWRRSPSGFVDLAEALWIILLRKTEGVWNRAWFDSERLRPQRDFWDYLPIDNVDAQINKEFQTLVSDLGSLDNKLGPKREYLISPIEKGTLTPANISEDSSCSAAAGE